MFANTAVLILFIYMCDRFTRRVSNSLKSLLEITSIDHSLRSSKETIDSNMSTEVQQAMTYHREAKRDADIQISILAGLAQITQQTQETDARDDNEADIHSE